MLNKLSIIIPCLNEEAQLPELLSQLKALGEELEIIISDGGSTDNSHLIAQQFGVEWISGEKGRSRQLNKGAKHSNRDFLFFMHADALPSKDFKRNSIELLQKGIELANFQLKLSGNHALYPILSFFTKSSSLPFQYGDQGLWLSKRLFKQVNGFDESVLVAEDNEILRRLVKQCPLHKVNDHLLVSDRSYQKYGAVWLQWLYIKLYFKFRMGISQSKILSYYEREIKARSEKDLTT